MTHEQLWAPWRMNYIAIGKPSDDDGCFLCRYRDEAADAENFVVARSELSLTVLNRFPYNNGHLLVAPKAHRATFDDLNDDELCDCIRQVKSMTALLSRVMAPQGFNVGLNLGKVAGAGMPGHLHWHIVPRWAGDTNFMPVLADVNLVPQSLIALYNLLRGGLVSPGNS